MHSKLPYNSLGLIGLVLFFCLGCAEDPPLPPPPLPPTQINLQINSDKTINPDANGKAAPVLLRIYELKEQSSFANADFFQLFDKEQPTLGPDLVSKQELQLKPDEKKALPFEPDKNTKQLGFFAAFRDLDNAQWRAVATLNLHNINSIVLNITGTKLNLTIEPPKVEKKEDQN